MLELLAEKILTATPNQVPLGIGDGFRRIIEAVGSGFLSPCEFFLDVNNGIFDFSGTWYIRPL